MIPSRVCGGVVRSCLGLELQAMLAVLRPDADGFDDIRRRPRWPDGRRRSRRPRRPFACTRSTAKPLSGLWKVTRSMMPDKRFGHNLYSNGRGFDAESNEGHDCNSAQVSAHPELHRILHGGNTPMHPVLIGTCGWSYKEWTGVFYPRGLPAGEFLAHYAERYRVVEVDSTFYHSPSRKLVQGWRNRTPAKFGFSLKVPQVITHEKKLLDCQGEVTEFVTAGAMLEDKLLCCILQFGYFNKSAFASLDAFLERLEPFLEAWPKDVPLAVEVRNKNWVTEKLAERLRAHQAVWTLTDQVWMPSPLSTVQKMDTITGPFAYVRILGDRAAVDALTPTLDHIVLDRGDQLRDDAAAIRLLRARVPVLIFVNNHFAGYSPETIRELQELLKSEPDDQAESSVTPA